MIDFIKGLFAKVKSWFVKPQEVPSVETQVIIPLVGSAGVPVAKEIFECPGCDEAPNFSRVLKHTKDCTVSPGKTETLRSMYIE